MRREKRREGLVNLCYCSCFQAIQRAKIGLTEATQLLSQECVLYMCLSISISISISCRVSCHKSCSLFKNFFKR